MGWSGTKAFLWGDEPQDIVDAALDKHFEVDFDTYWGYSDSVKREALEALKVDGALRAAVDQTYVAAFDRPVNDKEFNNLLIVGLGMRGGRTAYWGSKQKVGKIKSKGNKRPSPRTSVRGLR